jgi:predicted unusual protein kinase regulating ubiquinone biosynthesis (AarF/ABC1/UbiB family)
MARRWDELAGERGRKVDTSRVGRAFKLGRVAAGFAGSMLKAQVQGRKASDDEKIEAVADAAMKNVHQIVRVMGEMKGAAMKVGQMLSTDPDLVAPEFADTLAKLQKTAPPMDYVTVCEVIEAAYDRPIDAVFAFFDPEPLGSASIGQVHRARLTDGAWVAVKVQYPGIEASLDADLKNLGSLLKVGRVFMTKARTDAFVQEARDAILSETDYLLEAHNLQLFHDRLEGFDGVRVPRPHLELCHRTVLVMDFIEGEKLDDALMALPDAARRTHVAKRFVELFVHLFHDHHCLHGDPHPGNFMLDADDNVVLLDFGCVREFEPATTDRILHMLRAYWTRDMGRLSALLQAAGFGKPGMTMPTHEVLQDYLDLILEPLREDAPFNYSTWKVHARARLYLRKHLVMVRLVPPSELLLYFRVLVGMKGIMSRVDAAVNLRAIAESACERRGI